MRIYSLPAEAAAIADTPRTVALGVFDGVHLGHRVRLRWWRSIFIVVVLLVLRHLREFRQF